VNRYTGPPATLGSTASAQVRVIVWCRDCRHQVEPDPAEHAARYGAELPVRTWVERLKCSQCGSRSIDFVLTGAQRSGLIGRHLAEVPAPDRAPAAADRSLALRRGRFRPATG
jgi:hypothetical protein